jgi:3-methyladenine DNA glycosylase AlkD
MKDYEMILEQVKQMYGSFDNVRSKEINMIANKTYYMLPDNNDNLIELLDKLLEENNAMIFPLMTVWIKKRQPYDLKYLNTYEKWLYMYVNRWGRCDIYSYHVLNPMYERYQFNDKLEVWSLSNLTYVRRAAAVVMIKSTRSFEVNADIKLVLKIASSLANDKELHVQKGVGWLLKYAYIRYPEQIELFLRKNVKWLPRTVFRYALEKVPDNLRRELMKI